MAITVFVTIPKKEAENMAKMLVEERVCACVNIVDGVKSFFWWEGQVDTAEESLLIIKTKESLFSRLKEMVSANHSYSVPEIISFKIDNLNQPYLEWLNKEANAAPNT
ncbi:MAG: divalent-cation tolerance protein CutA [Candidatus Omnitrophica bacterium]|nr:divalent-cation tolerance protein CutA [Candidatus Omnitrophota bacterium]